MSVIFPEWKYELSLCSESQKRQYADDLEQAIAIAEQLDPGRAVEIALDQHDCFLEFGRRVDRLQEEGPDPNTLQPTKDPEIFFLKNSEWFIYFHRDIVSKTAQGLFCFWKKDKPSILAKALRSISIQWLK